MGFLNTRAQTRWFPHVAFYFKVVSPVAIFHFVNFWNLFWKKFYSFDWWNFFKIIKYVHNLNKMQCYLHENALQGDLSSLWLFRFADIVQRFRHRRSLSDLSIFFDRKLLAFPFPNYLILQNVNIQLQSFYSSLFNFTRKIFHLNLVKFPLEKIPHVLC